MSDCNLCAFNGECAASPTDCNGFVESVTVLGKLGSSLDEAKNVICGERQDQYGNPEDSFEIIARYWNVFLWAKLKKHGVDIPDLLTPLDTSNMQILFKQARKLGQKPKRDNYIDACGYEAIGADRLM